MGSPYINTNHLKDTPSEDLRLELIKRQQQENEMAKKEEPNKSGLNRHKEMAMGKSVELKGGGMAKKKEHKKEEHKKKK